MAKGSNKTAAAANAATSMFKASKSNLEGISKTSIGLTFTEAKKVSVIGFNPAPDNRDKAGNVILPYVTNKKGTKLIKLHIEGLGKLDFYGTGALSVADQTFNSEGTFVATFDGNNFESDVKELADADA